MTEPAFSPLLDDETRRRMLGSLSVRRSTAQKRRTQRNLLIHTAYRRGFSDLFIAEALDLSRRLIRQVIEQEEKRLDPGSNPGSAASTRPVVRGPRLPPSFSASKRRRWRRDLLIRMAWRDGYSQRMLAEVFELPRSRIGEIVRAED
jgi:hypothetical protein